MPVRLLMPGDFNEMLSLTRMQVEETLPHLDFRPDLVEQTMVQSVTSGDPLALVYEGPGGDITGFLVARIYEYTFSSGHFVSQEVIYVRPDKRGTRAAVELLREYIRWGRETGAREILFGVSNGHNPERTARLFEKLGAECVGFHHRIVAG